MGPVEVLKIVFESRTSMELSVVGYVWCWRGDKLLMCAICVMPYELSKLDVVEGTDVLANFDDNHRR